MESNRINPNLEAFPIGAEVVLVKPYGDLEFDPVAHGGQEEHWVFPGAIGYVVGYAYNFIDVQFPTKMLRCFDDEIAVVE